VRRIVLCLTCLVLTTSCETSTDPFIGFGGSGGGIITQAEATGDWSFTLRKTTTLTCSGGSLPDSQILTAHLDVLADGSVNTTTSTWRNPSTGAVLPASGTVRLSDGHTDVHFSAGSGSGAGMELVGTITSAGTFTGTVNDPDPGLLPMFSAGGCEYSAPGTKA
jgi:hypothetical protein